MTDRDRSDYDWDRRSSYPSRTWHAEQSSLPRPPFAQRSQTEMDPRLIARNANLKDKKRPASRSPDGAQPRKLTRPEPPRESPTASSHRSESRRSSVSNGTPRHPSVSKAPSQSRKASVQLNNERGGLFVNSPESRESQRESISSERSTPQYRTSVKSRPHDAFDKPLAMQNCSTDVKTGDYTSASSNSILDLLTTFSNQIATQASLQVSRDEASRCVQQAQEWHDFNRKQFSIFPAIGERKNDHLDAAKFRLNSAEATLSEHQAQRVQFLEGLATLIGQNAAVQPQAETSADAKDLVSRADHEALQEKYYNLQSDVNTANSALKTMAQGIAEIKKVAISAASHASQIPDLKIQLQTAEKDAKPLRDWRETVNNRLQSLTGIVNAARNELKAFKPNDLQNILTVQEELRTKHKTLAQDFIVVKNANAELSKTIGQVKAAKVAANINQAPIARASAVDAGLKEKVNKILEEAPDIIKRVRDLEQASEALTFLTKGDDNENLDAPIDEGSSLSKKMHFMSLQMDRIRISVQGMLVSVTEEGKPSVIKRLKNIDHILNNLSSQIQSDDEVPVTQRVKELERDMSKLQQIPEIITSLENQVSDLPSTMKRVSQLEKDQKALKGAHEHVIAAKDTAQRQHTSSGCTVDLKPLEDRINKLQGNLNFDRAAQDEADGVVRDHMNGRLEPLETNLVSQVSAHEEDLNKSNERVAKIQDSLDSLQRIMGSKVDITGLEAFRSDLLSLQEIVKSMQASQQKARTPSQSQNPTPGPSNGPPFGVLPPSQLPNGVAGSPIQPSSVQQQTHNNALQNSSRTVHPFAAPHQTHDVGKMQQQIESLVSVFQHLKQRFDNLTTDEMVRQMVDQFSNIYPEPKTFSLFTRDMSRSLTEVQKDLERLKNTTDRVNNEIPQLVRRIEDVSRDVSDMGKMKPDVESLKKEMGRVSISPGSASAAAVSCDHSHLATKAELGRADRRLVVLEVMTDKHDGDLSKGGMKLEEVQGKMKSMQKSLGLVEGKIMALEEE